MDNAVVDDDEYAVYDDVGFIAHQGMVDRDPVADVEIEIYKYNETTGDWEYHASLVTNESGEAWLYNQACGHYEWNSNPPDNGPEDEGYYQVLAHCDISGGGGGDEDHDEWFYDWNYYGAHDENDEHQWNKVIIGYDPDTECDCDMDIYVEANIWDENGDYVDYSSENHTINNGQSD